MTQLWRQTYMGRLDRTRSGCQEARVGRTWPSPLHLFSEPSMGLRALCLLSLLSLFNLAQPAHADDGSFVIGIMNDQSGPYADLAGPSSVEAVRMAIEDFGPTVLGKKI